MAEDNYFAKNSRIGQSRFPGRVWPYNSREIEIDQLQNWYSKISSYDQADRLLVGSEWDC